MGKHGCVYLAIVGGCSAVYTPLSEITGEFWPELTPVDTQRLKLRLHAFGPLYVAMDTNGNSIYAECVGQLPGFIKRLGFTRNNITLNHSPEVYVGGNKHE